ncbi:N-methyl-L-tryptophan oxidase [Phytopseudomonas dryadis]|uniref:N-methyl-L-tryptophan oxidase n=1 Tax=Phytopseudomonas dryadis TaxID=2487520 RepID=A0A4Q9R1L1_9GAMM|nr:MULTISPECIES: N-methyl-L-tryptophan oxidase [Pseudomonas]TBU92776.1 N-methyl-L-tryptophan oxidase [Pseudomonas dryadis]TBV03268.1 N-methyl-L-tryptophan oxidase [Pseudomonas dryadis]TBV16358.1 N-methyl-L-tryptophan oxidase [Pseudomonas sp. FRB 230]
MHYDVIVIGMGAMGAATLYQLARRGVRVAGLDRHAPPHDQGSSHGDTRITRQAVGEGAAYVPLALNAQRIWRELEAQSGVSLFEACGMLMLSSSQTPTRGHGTADFAGETAALAKRFGIEHRLLDAAQIRQRFPQFGGFGEQAVGYYEPGAGYVRPERCIQVQLQLARQLGATLHPDTPVTGIESLGQGVRVRTAAGSLSADRVIVSAGMWTGRLLGEPFERLLRVCRQQLLWFELDEPERFAPGAPVYILLHGAADTDSCYGFPPLPGENAIKIATEQYLDSSDPDDVDRSVSQADIDALYDAHVAGRLLGVSKRLLKSKVCTYTLTPDFDFIIDAHPELAGVTVVSACSGHGFKHSAGIGEALAMHHCNEPGAVDLSAFALARLAAGRA